MAPSAYQSWYLRGPLTYLFRYTCLHNIVGPTTFGVFHAALPAVALSNGSSSISIHLASAVFLKRSKGIQPVANQHEQIGMGQLPVWCWCCFPICMSATGILQQQLPAWPEIHSHARMDWRALYNLYMIWARLNAHTILLFHAQSETSARTCWTQLQHADLTACTLP